MPKPQQHNDRGGPPPKRVDRYALVRDVFSVRSAATAHEIAPKRVESMTAERFKAGFLTCLRNDEKGNLERCSLESIAESLRMAALVGLVPGEGKCYLIPYGSQCTLSIGVWGLIELMRRSGKVVDLNTGVVRDRDAFRVILEGPADQRGVYHEQNAFDRGGVVGYYATARLKGFEAPLVETMSVEEVEQIRQTSAKSPNSPAWRNYFDEMGRKVCLRRLSKRVPMEPDDLRRLQEVEESEYHFSDANGDHRKPPARQSIPLPRTIDARSQPAEDEDQSRPAPAPEDESQEPWEEPAGDPLEVNADDIPDGPPPLRPSSFGDKAALIGEFVRETKDKKDPSGWIANYDPAAKDQLLAEALDWAKEARRG